MSAPLPTTRLIILASAELYREAWRALLSSQPYITVVGTVGDVDTARTLLTQDGLPTTILVDLPGIRSDVARELEALVLGIGVLFLMDSYELTEILPLLQSGVTGCLVRDATPADLSRAIIAAGRGEIVLPPSIAARALAALAGGKAAHVNPAEDLTGREIEVLTLLAQGMTNKDIAQTLFLSVRTIEAHLRSIYDKLNVASRTEAALWAVRNGFAPQESR
jgi:two-component system NarL family response regulator